MKAADLMTSPVITGRGETTVGEAAKLMLKHHIGSVVLLDDDGGIAGIITHGDFGLHPKYLPLANHIYTIFDEVTSADDMEEATRDLKNRTVGEVMATDVETVEETTPVSEVARVMVEHKIRHLPVMRGKEMVGIISRHDLLKIIASVD